MDARPRRLEDNLHPETEENPLAEDRAVVDSSWHRCLCDACQRTCGIDIKRREDKK